MTPSRSQRERSAQRRQEIARNGGRARAEKLTPERRQEIARLGGTARSEKTRYTGEPDPVELKRRVAALVLIIRHGDQHQADAKLRKFADQKAVLERRITQANARIETIRTQMARFDQPKLERLGKIRGLFQQLVRQQP